MPRIEVKAINGSFSGTSLRTAEYLQEIYQDVEDRGGALLAQHVLNEATEFVSSNDYDTHNYIGQQVLYLVFKFPDGPNNR